MIQRASHQLPEPQAYLVLVVEDELLIAMEVTAVLEESGFRVLGPVASVRAALTLLNQQRPDAAVLDMSLRGEMVTPVAHILRRMGVPYVIASAYDRADWPQDEALNGIPNLGKPTSPSDLTTALGSLLRGGS